MGLESLSSEFQHFEIKVSSKSTALYWIYVYIWVALIFKKTKAIYMEFICNLYEIIPYNGLL